MVKWAFKEWASVCCALEQGTQSIILRKGGIAEQNGQFVPEHSRFWLYPTYFHEQQLKGLKSNSQELLVQSLNDKPPTGILRFRLIADLVHVSFVDDLDRIHALDPWHVWTRETIEQRFHYRNPGLNVICVRMIKSVFPHEIAELTRYSGCKSWVELEESLSDDGVPVMNDVEHETRIRSIQQVLTE